MNTIRNYGTKVIKNTFLPDCKKCIYYKLDDINKSYELSRCTKFRNINTSPVEINYDFTDTCRNSEYLCGTKGRYWLDSSSIIFNDFKLK